MGRQADDGVGAEDAPRQRDRRVVLSHVDPVGPDLERQVGPVVEHEGHAVLAADRGRDAGPSQQRPRVEVLVAELDDVHPARDAARRGSRPGRAGPACRGRGGDPRGRGRRSRPGAAPGPSQAFLVALTFARLSASTMSATERWVPGSP